MRRPAILLAGAACATAMVAMPMIPLAQQPTGPPPMLLRTDLAGIPGQEAILQFVQIPPGGRAPKHVHPDGHEIIYVLEGETFLEMEGQQPRSAKAGQVLHVPPNIPHGGGNSSATAPLKLLVIRIKDRSKPIMVLLK
jgi:quercetin dioxygenase-like cupin family protein